MPIRRISPSLVDDICGSFSALATLSLAKNEIAEVENLERLAPSLTKLDLSHNILSPSPAGLLSLTRLVHLDLSHNQLCSLSGLERLVALEILHAGHNAIQRTDALRSLAYLPKLHTLTLSDNGGTANGGDVVLMEAPERCVLTAAWATTFGVVERIAGSTPPRTGHRVGNHQH